VLAATPREWEKVEGVGPAVSRFLETVSYFCQMFEPVEDKGFPAKYEEKTFYAFLKERYEKFHDYEHLSVFCMDEESRFFNKRDFSAFEKDTVMIDSEAIADYLSEVKPSGVVIAHNHPVSESSLPSEYDDEATERFRTVCSVQNVLFCDHLICSDQGIYSYRKSDKIPDYEQVKKQRGQS
jgi:DNA repair protein RadC